MRKLLPYLLVFWALGIAHLSAQVQVIAAKGGVSAQTLAAVGDLARAGIRRLAPNFPGTPTKPIRFVIHGDESSIPAPLRASLHPGVPGFARLQMHEIHIVMRAIQVDPPNDLQTTVEHELVHILLDQYCGRSGRYVARWFHEGLAQDLSGDGYLGLREQDLVYQVRMRTFLPFPSLDHGFPVDSPEQLALAYSQSYSFVAFLRRELGLPLLLEIAKSCSKELRFDIAFASKTREGLAAKYEDLWIDYLLKSSGAGFRFILGNCFVLVLLAVVGPLLAVAVARRRNREESMKSRLGDQDRLEDEWLSAQDAEAQRAAEEPVDWDDWDVGVDDPDYQVWGSLPSPQRVKGIGPPPPDSPRDGDVVQESSTEDSSEDTRAAAGREDPPTQARPPQPWTDLPELNPEDGREGEDRKG